MANRTNDPAVRASARWRTVAAVLAAVFGIATIWSGGSVVLEIGEARADAGSYVPFVVWFNFLAGFLYVLAGVGLLFRCRWAAGLSIFLALATLLVFGALGVHILNGGSFETRTIAAMTLRSVFWLTIAWFAKRHWSNG